MPGEAINEVTRQEWRELGFFYDLDVEHREWRLIGSKDGLATFAQLIRRYAASPRSKTLSEHDHLGPYMYLEIGTWSSPEITDHWIAGRLEDLWRLATVMEEKLRNAIPGDRLSLRDVFAPESAYDLVLEVREEGFDPARADPLLANDI